MIHNLTHKHVHLVKDDDLLVFCIPRLRPSRFRMFLLQDGQWTEVTDPDDLP